MKKQQHRRIYAVGIALLFSALAWFAGTERTAEAASKIIVKKVTSTDSLTGNKTIKLAKGKKATLKTTVTVSPDKSANKKVKYKSSNPKIASVTAKGVITGKKAGTAKITVSSSKNKKKKAVVTVKVVKGRVTSVKLDKTSASIAKGNTLKLKASVETSAGGSKDVVWTTSNKKIATVSSRGTVKGVGTGTAVITAKAADGTGKKASCRVKIKKSGGISFAEDTISAMYTSSERRIRVVCSSSKHGKISWKSSNTEVADFVIEADKDDVEGESVLLYAEQAGTTTIKATVDGKSVSRKITVTDFKPKYTYEINFLNQPYANLFSIVYVKTENPSTDNFNLFFYDTATQKENEPLFMPGNGTVYEDLKSMGVMTPSFLYKTDGGYLGLFMFEIPGKTSITVQEFAIDSKGNKIYDHPGGQDGLGRPILENAELGYIDIKDIDKEQTAWMQSLINQVTTNSMTKKEKMQTITSYMLSHSVYTKTAADSGHYISLAADEGVPFWKFEKFEFNSYTSPALLTAFGKMINYPLENLYYKYKYGTPEWQAWHMVAQSIEDGTNYQFCPPTDSNVIDTDNIEQIDLSRWNFYTCYK
ncbi:MAG: hypothetical protein HFH50_10940 [Lachnospiraceae bacterium]|jgi:uncharacterized protein YjdB|nr:hypothetical protein [Lachnospiraceae bacterium]